MRTWLLYVVLRILLVVAFICKQDFDLSIVEKVHAFAYEKWGNVLQKLVRTEKDVLEISTLISEYRVFQHLTDDQKLEVSKMLQFRVVHEGHLLCRQWNPGDTFFIVLQGRVSLHVSQTTEEEVSRGSDCCKTSSHAFERLYGVCIHTLVAGDAFGEVSFRTPGALAGATARCETTCEFAFLQQTDFMNIAKSAMTAALLRTTGIKYSEMLRNEPALRSMSDIFTITLFLQNGGAKLFFSQFSRVTLERLARVVSSKRLAKGEIVMKQGSRSEAFYVLLSGTVELRSESTVQVIESGSALGQVCRWIPYKILL